MKSRLLLFVVAWAMLSAIGVGSNGAQSTPVQGSGETSAINAFQFQGPGNVRVGSESYSVVSTASVLGIVPGPGHTLLVESSHFIDFGNGNTITTSDEGLLVPVNDQGLFQLHIKATIVSGTGDFADATGDLTFNGRINLALGQATWMVHGQLR